MFLRKLAPSLATALYLGSFGLLAATITEQTLSVPGLAGRPAPVPHVVRLTGMIEQGDATHLRETLSRYLKSAPRAPGQPLATVELSSVGGDLAEGLKLGYLFREFDVATMVRAGDSCLSSCALAFLGGTASHLPTELVVARTIEVGGTLGFHNFFLNPYSDIANSAADPREGIVKGFDVARGGAALLVHYAASLGVDPAFIARMLGRPPDVWEYADRAGQFMDLKICPASLSIAVPSPQSRAVNICANAIGGATPAVPPQARRMLQLEAKKLLLQDVQRNVASFDVRGPLATELAAVIASRNDSLIDSVYADLRAAGLPLPEITGPTFQVSGFSAGVYNLQCVVSLSLDDPDRFDVVMQGPMGLARPAQKPPASCGRLFSFERSEMLNPERK
jgi:hypothetical protein